MARKVRRIRANTKLVKELKNEDLPNFSNNIKKRFSDLTKILNVKLSENDVNTSEFINYVNEIRDKTLQEIKKETDAITEALEDYLKKDKATRGIKF